MTLKTKWDTAVKARGTALSSAQKKVANTRINAEEEKEDGSCRVHSQGVKDCQLKASSN